MKQKKFYLITLTLLLITWYGCEKEQIKNTNEDKDFIITGVINENGFHDINDSISWEFNQEIKLPIDINNDNVTDFELKIKHTAYQGGTLDMFYSKLVAFNHIEILADTTLSSNEVHNHKEITAKFLNQNDTINHEGIWISDTTCNLCYSVDEMIYTEENDFYIAKSIFDGWNNLENKYLGYRYVSTNNDTVYGWLELKVKDFKTIYINQTSFN